MQGRRECLISRFAFYYMYGHLHGTILQAAKLFSPESAQVIDLKWCLLICQVSFWLCSVCAYVKHEICQGSMICKPQPHVSALIKMTHWLFMIRETERVLLLPAERRAVMVTGGSGEVARGVEGEADRWCTFGCDKSALLWQGAAEAQSCWKCQLMWGSLWRLGKKALSGETPEVMKKKESGDEESGLPRGPAR